MYTIGQVSAMFNLPVSTLRYYDKEGFFPNLERKGNIRYFSDNELEALRIIECLKKSGLEIKDIKQFFIWVSEGSSSYEKRKELFETRKSAVETEIQELQKTLFLLKFKCWYYETAMKDGNEDAINAMLPDKLPKICRNYMIKGMTDFCFLHQIVKETIGVGVNEKAVLRFYQTALSFTSISIFPWRTKSRPFRHYLWEFNLCSLL